MKRIDSNIYPSQRALIMRVTRKMLTILEWSTIVAIAFLVLIVVSSVIPGSFIGKSYIIVTGSMEPTIPIGSMVVTIPRTQYSLSDVIAFESPEESDKIIMHRAYSRNPENSGWITKGDGNEEPDKWIVEDAAIKGKAVAYLPYIGRLAIEARSPRGFLLYIGLPILLIMILYCIKIVQGVREYAKKEAEKAVEHYKQTQRGQHMRQISLALAMVVGGTSLFLTTTAYAVFFDRVSGQLNLTTASTFASPTPNSSPIAEPTLTPNPSSTPTATIQRTPSITPSLTPTANPGVVLNQGGASQTININAQTQNGNQTVIVGQSQSVQQNQSVQINDSSTTTNRNQ